MIARMHNTCFRFVIVLFASALAIFACSSDPSSQGSSVNPLTLREYVGAYQWERSGFLYLQMWKESTGTDQLVAVDESGEVRTLYLTDNDNFFAGPGVAVSTAIESRIKFQRDSTGEIVSLIWEREGGLPRVARPAKIDKAEDVRFSNGDIQLAGTLVTPKVGEKHPAIILVHGSGPMNRESMVPFAGFLVRRGMAILSYDKRGVARSGGDWKTASFEDLADDVIAAFKYLQTRADIDHQQIGLLGWSQAGWIMPLAAIREKDIAFLISVSGPGIPPAETTIDHARNEMEAQGVAAPVVAQIIRLMKLQYHYAYTGNGLEEYFEARQALVRRMGSPPKTFPGAKNHLHWHIIRQLYFYDPGPTLRQLQASTLGLFGELDNNVLPEKNMAAWKAALEHGRNPDYTLHILAKANHMMMEAKLGSNAEMPSLQRFVPAYFQTIQEWLSKRVPGFKGYQSKSSEHE
jgi:pimeloyl-ACP methyl ester carboxylesterase